MSARALGIALTLICTSCIGAGDMFAPSKRLVGPYELFGREGGEFSIRGPRKPATDAGGYIDGTIDSLGWTSERILVRRAQPMFSGDSAGWFVIDVRSGEINGPLTATGRAADPALARIVIRAAEDVWKRE